MATGYTPVLGMSEQELREALTQELLLTTKSEGEAPATQAIAHAVARVIEVDHLRMAEQLERAGVRLKEP